MKHFGEHGMTIRKPCAIPAIAFSKLKKDGEPLLKNYSWTTAFLPSFLPNPNKIFLSVENFAARCLCVLWITRMSDAKKADKQKLKCPDCKVVVAVDRVRIIGRCHAKCPLHAMVDTEWREWTPEAKP